jgi:hypothetical protein
MARLPTLLFAVVSFSSLAAAGCGGTTLYPVEGQVMLGNKPLPSGEIAGMVVLFPDGAGGPQIPGKLTPIGSIDKEGKYRIFSGTRPGAPAGKYRVTVQAVTGNIAAPVPAIAGKYLNQESTPLRFEVVSSPQAGAYDLKVTK